MTERNRERNMERQAEILWEQTRDPMATMFDRPDPVDVIEIFRMFGDALEMIGDGLESIGGAFDSIDLGW